MGVSDFAKGAADSAARKLNQKLRSSETVQKVTGAEDWLTEQRMTRKLGTESFRGTTITVHRGYAYGDTMKLVVKTSESARILEDAHPAVLDVAKANIRRHWSLALAGVLVRATFGDVAVEGITDRHGFVPLTLRVRDLAPGWHEVNVATVPHRDDIVEAKSVSGRVFKPHPQAPFAVISDLDDTVIRSGLTEGLTAVRRTLLGDHHTRRAIPGVSSWYRGMSRKGQVDGVEPGFFYVSTGSWSFYEMLVQFLQLRGFPRGPLFLTDWGPTDRYLHRSGSQHKKHTIGRLLQAYPHTPFVLVGDTGQGDFDAYTDAARHFPEQVKLIVLLPVGDEETETELNGKALALREQEDIPVHVVASVIEAAQLAYDAGLCDDLTLEEVQTELGAIF
jgi:phosphatidate phosphatase APP1